MTGTSAYPESLARLARHALGRPTGASRYAGRCAAVPQRASSRGEAFRIAVCAPLRGSAGIWGPSCIAAAQLAQAELNRGEGIAGRPGELHIVDASAEAPQVEATLADLAEGGEIDAVVGMCISSVRERIVAALGGRLPFV